MKSNNFETHLKKRTKDIYLDEIYTVRPKDKPKKHDDDEDIALWLETMNKAGMGQEGLAVVEQYCLEKYGTKKRHPFFNEDGTITMHGIFQELDEERRARKRQLKNS